MTETYRQAENIRVDVHLGPTDMGDALRSDVLSGLTSSPKELPPKWFYDRRGSALFEEITRLPEYYPTRCERAILREKSRTIAAVSGADTIVELGSGTSEKTRLILDAFFQAGRLERFIPFDVSEATLRSAARAVCEEYPGVVVHAVVGDFERHVPAIPREGRRLIAFLGGTIGNLPVATRAGFLSALAAAMSPGDSLLLGTDLVKDVGRLEAAYNDADGVTAAFNKNILSVLNRELAADFDPDRFAHVARYEVGEERIEMWLRSSVDQTVRVTALGLAVAFGDGEEMRTEISAKFRRETVEAELAAAGLEIAHWWTDPDGDFALSLSIPKDLRSAALLLR